MRGAIDTGIVVVAWGVAVDALVPELEVAPCDGFTVDGACDGNRIRVHVAHVHGRVSQAVTGFDQAVGSRQRFSHRDSPRPAARKSVAGLGRDGSRLGVSVR